MEILKDQDQYQAEGIMVFFCVDDSGRVAKVARGRPSIYIILYIPYFGPKSVLSLFTNYLGVPFPEIYCGKSRQHGFCVRTE